MSDDYRREKKKFVFFWKSGPFTQWYNSKFTGSSEFDPKHEKLEFCNAEQWMMFNKAHLMGDVVTAARIMETTNPKQIKQLGREVRSFSEKVWNKHKIDIVYQGNKLKFTQCEYLKEILINTAPKTLVEASPADKIWGIGLNENDPNAPYPDRWKGQNLLGNILTRLRDDLIEMEQKN